MKIKEEINLIQFMMLAALFIMFVTSGCELIDLSESNDTFIEETAGGDFVKVTIDSQGDAVPTIGDSNNDEGGGVVTGDDSDSNLDTNPPGEGSE